MVNIKNPAVAGTFYPGQAEDLQLMLTHLLENSRMPSLPQPRAMIVPHAGYIFSGPIAANAYRVLQTMPQIKQVILIGPSHHVYIQGAVLPTASYFRTPLGDLPVNAEFVSTLLKLPEIGLLDEAFKSEHSLEVQLPFLQRVLPECSIVPILVGHPAKEVIANILETFYQREDTFFIISSDLSHYHDYPTAVSRDQQTMNSILRLDADALQPQQACGCFAIKGLLHFAKQKNWQAQLMDLRNSGDTQGDKKRVVGYSAVHFYEPIAVIEQLTKENEKVLLQIARSSIDLGLKQHQLGQIVLENLPPIFHYQAATFVTLHKQGKLRGCIGSLVAREPLAKDVLRNAYAAAFEDKRFPPLQIEELPDLTLDISLLSELKPIQFCDQADLLKQLQPKVDGLLIADQKHRAVFLPMVWETLPTPEQFIRALKQKGGWAADYWSQDLQAWRFTTRIIRG